MNTTPETPSAAIPGPDDNSLPGNAPLPFSQLPGESARAAEAFRVYLELGPRRRYSAVVRRVGVSLRTVKRWAMDFDWRGRLKSCAAQGLAQYAHAEAVVRQEEFLDLAARTRALRERQFALAEAFLDAAENYFERLDPEDLNELSFADACKALELSSRVGQQAADHHAAEDSAPATGLRDQLSSLLNQVFKESPPPAGASAQPQKESHA